jgi:hypothetical protein
MLSAPQKRMLVSALRLAEDHGADGYIPEGPGEWSTVRALQRRGLMEFAGVGGCIDDSRRRSDCGDDFPIYALTESGLTTARELTAQAAGGA